MANTNSKRDSAEQADPKGKATTKIILDYRGTVGAAQGQPETDHVRTPLVIPVPEHGRQDIVLHPGINVLEREQWDHIRSLKDGKGRLVAEARQLEELVNAGRVIEIQKVPDNHFELSSMIERTVSDTGFAWLKKAAARASQGSEALLNMIEVKISKTSMVDYKPSEYQSNASIGLADAV